MIAQLVVVTLILEVIILVAFEAVMLYGLATTTFDNWLAPLCLVVLVLAAALVIVCFIQILTGYRVSL